MIRAEHSESASVPRPSRYAADTYFLETCDALAALNIDAAEFARRNAVVLLKPDAAVTGGMRAAVDWLLEHRYRVLGAHAVQFTHLHIRALWYFNWHRATPERRRLADQLARMSPSVVLMVTHPDSEQPVSVRLTADKGPADPARRKPGELRYALAAGTYLLNQIHTPDDPEDVLRELSIYFPEPQLSEVISACAAGADASRGALRLVDRIQSGVDRKSADLAAVQDALWEDLRKLGMTDRPRTGADWLAALDEAQERDVEVDPWFRLVVESAHLAMHRHGE
jgi:hypothetical protein